MYWQRIIADRPADWWDTAAQILMTILVCHLRNAARLADEIRTLWASKAPDMERLRALSEMQRAETKAS